ncbi:hypothetical protein KIW84_042410 [Lathyrus oleraceus]|uniref:Uncharacterized protein n=1 Tax=Pisum sativum TaxID=3888 RepID=A0A9D4XCP0_PEA|nr:hypothetical protein KIW84_042410 [Pisum sativum]
MEPKLPNEGSSSNPAMEPKHPNEETFVYAYLMEKGYEKTAEIFRNDTQISIPMPDLNEPPGFLSDFWNIFYDTYNSRARQRNEQTSPQNQQPTPSNAGSTQNQVIVQQRSNTSTQNQVIVQPPNIGPPFICYTENRIAVTAKDTHTGTITHVRFHPDCKRFATASADRTVKLWNAATHQTVLHHMNHSVLRHKGAVRSLDFHPFDYKTLCSSDDTEIKVWDVNTCVTSYSSKDGGGIVRVQPLYGRLLAVANGNAITILDSRNLVFVRKLEGHVKDIKSMCWDVTGQMIASVSEDEARVWSASDGQCIGSYPSKERKFQSVIFHPRYHKALVIGGHKCLLSLNLESMSECTTRDTQFSITALAAAKAQSQFIASGSDDGVVKIWK